MGTYIILTRLTDDGAATIKSNPERIREVNADLEKMNVQVKTQYATLGEIDFLSIVEAPDNETVMRAAIELGSRGTVRVQSLPAIPVDELIASVKSSA